MGLKRWLKRRKWKKFLIALAIGGGGYGAWIGLIADSKPVPVSDIRNVTVESMEEITKIYGNYSQNR